MTNLEIASLILLLTFALMLLIHAFFKGKCSVHTARAAADAHILRANAIAQGQVSAAESYQAQVMSMESVWQEYIGGKMEADQLTLTEIKEARATFENMYPFVGDPKLCFTEKS